MRKENFKKNTKTEKYDLETARRNEVYKSKKRYNRDCSVGWNTYID